VKTVAFPVDVEALQKEVLSRREVVRHLVVVGHRGVVGRRGAVDMERQYVVAHMVDLVLFRENSSQTQLVRQNGEVRQTGKVPQTG